MDKKIKKNSNYYSMKKVVIINGTATVGKNEFCDFCCKYIPCTIISTVDKVKEAYQLLGWKGDIDKSEIHRKALSDIKDIGTKNLDHPYTYVKKQINIFKNPEYYEKILFVHSREPDEIDRFVKSFNGTSLLIRNPSVETITSNHADAEVENYTYDYIVENNGTLEDLENNAVEFINKLIGNDE